MDVRLGMVLWVALTASACACGTDPSPTEADAEVDAPIDSGLDANICEDIDGDGIGDLYERQGGRADWDRDGITNERDTDSDGDGLLDRDEHLAEGSGPCLWPQTCSACGSPSFLALDGDGDAVDDAVERENGTDDCDFDSDDDGCPDGLDESGCGPEQVILIWRGCGTTETTFSIVTPEDGGSHEWLRATIVDATTDRTDVLAMDPLSATGPGVRVEGGLFWNVPPGAVLTLHIATTSDHTGFEELYTRATVALVDEAGTVVASKPLHLFEPECCVLVI